MTSRLAVLAIFALFTISTAQTPLHKPTPPPSAKPSPDAQLYRNPAFNFRYQIPYGWVDRTKEMQEGNDASKGEVLLAIFERPPQAAGDTINSAVVIASEKSAAYPRLKKAEDYLAPLTELTTAKGFKLEGDVWEAEVGAQHLVRADFSKALNEKLNMHQSTLVLLAKGQIVTFTFIADTTDAVNDLIESLSFWPTKSKTK
ncbi:MAG TPA: hypothetical protein VNW47_16170 [Terriglobales bacterium]|nr:hypothetical protein [Terriglobales bacterium]